VHVVLVRHFGGAGLQREAAVEYVREGQSGAFWKEGQESEGSTERIANLSRLGSVYSNEADRWCQC
jgi:hypothetical protein